MKDRLVFVHRIDKDNVGDLACSIFNSLPLSFLDVLKKKYELVNLDIKNPLFIRKNDILIIGGGGLLNLSFQKFWDKVISRKNKFIILGAGENFGSNKISGIHNTVSSEEKSFEKEILSNSLYSGLRDKITHKNTSYCPCPSIELVSYLQNFVCKKTKMKPLVIQHHQVRADNSYPDSFEVIDNSKISALEMISKISQASEVYTSSYHGYLWSFWQRKKVLALPFSSKFTASRHIKKIKLAKSIKDFDYKIKNDFLSQMHSRAEIGQSVDIIEKEKKIYQNQIKAAFKKLLCPT